MKRRFAFALAYTALSSLAPVLGSAQDALSGAEFEAYVEGKTLYYSGVVDNYGIEQYLPGRRVIWRVLENDCQYGKWYENEVGHICFVYEEDPTPKCWTFWKENDALAARFENDPQGTELYEVRQTNDPLICLGPDVGA